MDNSSEIKQAKLLIYAQSNFKVQVNNRWVNQLVQSNQLSAVDLTGYVQKGDNRILLAFPFEEGEKAFAAELKVEFFNSNITALCTDTSWMQKDNYNYPSQLSGFGGFKTVEVVQSPIVLQPSTIMPKTYEITIPEHTLDGLSNAYLQIEYSGDNGKLYYDGHLIADDFYNGTIWEIGLNRLPKLEAGKKLILEIMPMSPDKKVYFDIENAREKALKANVKSVKLIPEYKISLH